MKNILAILTFLSSAAFASDRSLDNQARYVCYTDLVKNTLKLHSSWVKRTDVGVRSAQTCLLETVSEVQGRMPEFTSVHDVYSITGKLETTHQFFGLPTPVVKFPEICILRAVTEAIWEDSSRIEDITWLDFMSDTVLAENEKQPIEIPMSCQGIINQ